MLLTASIHKLRVRISPIPNAGRYSTTALLQKPVETVQVRTRTGHITLDIHNPPTPSTKPSNALILHLPSGPALAALQLPLFPTVSDSAVSALLSRASNTRVAQLNYRAAPPFPTSLHDVLAAYDFARQQLLPGRVGVAGCFAGGSLALSLALSESGVAAASVHAPVLDWTGLPEGRAPLLHGLREALFARGDAAMGWADPFASAVLWLRTTRGTMQRRDGEEDVEGEVERKRRGRVYPLRFPPAGSGLRVPEMRVGLPTPGGEGSLAEEEEVLRGQGEEMVKLLRRAVARWDVGVGFGGETKGGEEDGRARMEEAERRVQGIEGGGIWCFDGGERWREEVEEMGVWLSDRLKL